MASEKQQVSGGGAAPMCANGCGFFGSAATKNMCSKCYKEHVTQTAAAVAAAPPAAEKKAAESVPAVEESGGSSEGAKEEHGAGASGAEDSAPAPVMCANGCSFFGSAATKNLCSSCYRDLLKAAAAGPAVAEKIEVAATARSARCTATPTSMPATSTSRRRAASRSPRRTRSSWRPRSTRSDADGDDE